MKKIKYGVFIRDTKVKGVLEQYKRALRLYHLAQRCKKQSTKFFNLIAAIYPSRAIAEIMLEAAEKQELKKLLNKDIKKSRKEFEKQLVQRLPYYYLIEKIRIHDFHRFGCLPPDPKHKKTFFGGPVKLTVIKGTMAMTITSKGPQFTKTGNSSIKEQRTLCTFDGHFYDEESEKFLLLSEILEKYLSAVPEAIAYFEAQKAE